MSETDRRLKDYLDTNQAARERLCLDMMQIMPRFTDVRPRLPKGGPDGGADIDALYEGKLLAVGAVGFVNGATDLEDHRRSIARKFTDDLAKAAAFRVDRMGRRPTVFVFFTNVGLTPGSREQMERQAFETGMTVCEIWDRERIRTLLDSTDGFVIRSRYLGIAMSDEEQKQFFANWGDSLQSMMATGLGTIEAQAKRTNFLLEAMQIVDQLFVRVNLTTAIGDIGGGDLVFQVSLAFNPHVDGLVSLTFGTVSDPIVETVESIRSTEPHHTPNQRRGYGSAWIAKGSSQRTHVVGQYGEDAFDERDRVPSHASSSVHEIERDVFYLQHGASPFIERYGPTFRLMDLDGMMLVFDCSAAIAEHISEITITGNAYEIVRIERDEMGFEECSADRLHLPEGLKLPDKISKFVTIRPKLYSSFTVDFMSKTPTRLF